MERFRIHPAIGVARVGNSDEDYYLAPDAWQTDFVPSGGYRDADDKIKRMGCRFRIYEFDQSGIPVREITQGVADVDWSVHLVNKKSAKADPLIRGDRLNPDLQPTELTLDPGEHRVSGINQDVEVRAPIGPSADPIDVKLGNLLTDVEGRLVVLGGHGRAGSWRRSPVPPSRHHNRDWFDDTSDGIVKARITFDNGETFEAQAAWVLVGIPDFAHPVVNLVTLYDLIWDRSVPAPLAAPVPSFTQDIYPLLHRAASMQWTLMSIGAMEYGRTAMHGHGFRGSDPANHEMHQGRGDFLSSTVFPQLHDLDPANQWLREHVFGRLKDPRTGGGHGPGEMGVPYSMPPLEQLTITPTQYAKFEAWSQGNFTDDWDATWDPADPPQLSFATTALEDQPAVLDRAALDGAVGGSFAPGIEAGSKIAEAATYREPFRIDTDVIAPGDLTQELSVPWQAGLNLCTGAWWPGARPVLVAVKDDDGDQTAELWTRPYTSSVPIVPTDVDSWNVYENYTSIYENQRMAHNLCMVDHWSDLGFIARDTSVAQPWYIETERSLPG